MDPGLVLLGALAAWSPLLGAAAAGYLVGVGRIGPEGGIIAVLAGLMAESAFMWGLGRGLGPRAPRLPVIRRRIGGRFSETDWARRFGRLGNRGIGFPADAARDGDARSYSAHAPRADAGASPGRAMPQFAAGLRSRFEPWSRAEWALACGILRAAPPGLAAGATVGMLAWAALAVAVAAAMAAPIARAVDGPAWIGIAAGVLLTAVALNIAQYLATWTGRQRLRARLSRMAHHEFWPPWVFYLPLVPWLAWLGLRHGGLMTFSCANPGIEGGGGIVGESKSRIMAGLGAGERILEAHLVEGGPAQERVLKVKHLLESRPGLRGPGAHGFPVILKPDSGQRGHAVRLARDFDDVLAYFQEMTRPAVVQKYHPGPHEAGAMWVRNSAQRTTQGSNGTASVGAVFSVVRKDFPVVVGDGRRTLEELVYAHPRLRCQADVFLTRFADERSRVLVAGEAKRLAEAGNHCQGTLFRDGGDLASAALASALDELARRFPGRDGAPGGLDFGRFDFRYESDESLREGRGFAVVELNGTTGESTNLYDPARSLWWAYGVLLRQWAELYRVGAARRREGVRPMSVGALARVLLGYYGKRRGPEISD